MCMYTYLFHNSVYYTAYLGRCSWSRDSAVRLISLDNYLDSICYLPISYCNGIIFVAYNSVGSID